MNDDDLQLFEAELRRLKPSEPPPELVQRLKHILPRVRPPAHARSDARSLWASCSSWLRWLAPATAVLLALAIVLLRQESADNRTLPEPTPPAPAPTARADQLEVDTRFLAEFDVIGRLPTGEPVRIRCREWQDQILLRDSRSAVAVEHVTPRLEILSVRYDTY